MASVAPAVTPVPGVSHQIVTGGSPVVAVAANPNGGFITNPVSSTDQGVTAEVLYVNPYGNATTSANNTTFALQPGQTWNIIPGQTTPTSVNAATTGHKFSVVSF